MLIALMGGLAVGLGWGVTSEPASAFDGTTTPNTALLAPGDGLHAVARPPDGGEKTKALTSLEYAADQGHLEAQWKVGRMYADGDGVPQDDLRAFNYFSQIANTHPEESPGTPQARLVANAFVALAHYYIAGIPNSTIKPDVSRAREMLDYAASYFGDADAQYQLGRLYLDGSPSDPH
jgi:hypothetical protein